MPELWMAEPRCGQLAQAPELLSVPRATMGKNKWAPACWRGPTETLNVGGDLLSHTLASAVPSALEGLASGFGMGPGVSPTL